MKIEAATLSVMDGQQIESPAEMTQTAVRQGMLYVMVEVSAPLADWDEISRDLVNRAIKSVTGTRKRGASALIFAATELNDYLCQQNERLSKEKKVWASFNAVFIRNNKLILAQAGPALTYFMREDSIQRYPTYLQKIVPLGAGSDLPCQITRLSLEPNDIICLSAYHLPTIATEATIYRAMQARSASDVAYNLALLTDEQEFSAYVLQYEPTAKAPDDSANPNDTTVISRQTEEDSTESIEFVNLWQASLSEFWPAAKLKVVTLYSQFSWSYWRDRFKNGLWNGYSWLSSFIKELLIGWRDWLRPRLANKGPALDEFAHRFAGWMRRLLYALRDILYQTLPGTHTPPPPPAEETFSPAGDGSDFVRIITITVLLFLLVLRVGWWLVQPNVTEEQAPSEEATASAVTASESEPQHVVAGLMVEAAEKIAQAEGVDEKVARDSLSRANELLNQALAHATTPEQTAQVRGLQHETLLKLDGLDNVTRPPVTMLARLLNRRPSTLIYGSHTLFVLEGNAIYRLAANHPSTNPLQNPFSVLQASFGTLKTLVWVPAGGARAHDGLLLITNNGQMFSVDVNSGQLQELATPSLTATINASAGYNGNLYLLDRTSRQIWKYQPNQQGEYPAAAVPWLTSAAQEKISDPIDMAIDGYIFLLSQSSLINRFAGGQHSRNFSLDHITPPLTQPVAIAKVPPETSHLFVADHERIVRFDHKGRLIAQYRAPLDSNWGQIRNLAVNEEGDALYLLSDNGVYLMQITP